MQHNLFNSVESFACNFEVTYFQISERLNASQENSQFSKPIRNPCIVTIVIRFSSNVSSVSLENQK